jgi:hypothetical protein
MDCFGIANVVYGMVSIFSLANNFLLMNYMRRWDNGYPQDGGQTLASMLI